MNSLPLTSMAGIEQRCHYIALTQGCESPLAKSQPMILKNRKHKRHLQSKLQHAYLREDRCYEHALTLCLQTCPDHRQVQLLLVH